MWLLLSAVLLVTGSVRADLESDAKKFVTEAEKKLQAETQEAVLAEWNYESNINDTTLAVHLKAKEKSSKLQKQLGREAMKFDPKKIKDEATRRKLMLLSDIGTAVLRPDKLRKFNALVADMTSTYASAKVREYEELQEEYSLEPHLTLLMAKLRDPEQLQYYWTQWREQSGKQMRGKYMEYVKYMNEAARENGFKDGSEMKVVGYESDTFMQEMEDTWQGLKPLYQQLHAYVRRKLNQHYGDKVVKKTGPIPAHLLGNMWGQSWSNLGDILSPYPKKPTLNVTGAMLSQKWSPTIMFQKADEFFQSMGLDPMPKEFWSGSILEKPKDGRELTCHASAWDFYNGKDFRIKQCTRVNQEDFVTVNHEMGHIQYYLQYKNLPHLFRTGANAGFHEGVADITSLAVGTATYFQRLGLLDESVNVADDETDINILFDMALQRIAFLPFGYLVDKFRWDVYSGKTSMENMNCHWWKLRHEIQGLTPPVKRSYTDFDAGSKYHVAANVGYVRYFTAFIYEFQFYRELCKVSGKYVKGDKNKPLHRCNFYGSRAAGDKLKEMLKLGASKPWKVAMKTMTGQPDMNTDAIREYFKPLENWLIKENKKSGVKVDWGGLNVNTVCKQAPGIYNGQDKSGAGMISWSNWTVLLTVSALLRFY